MARKTNQPLLDELTAQERAAVMTGADAVKVMADYRRKSFDLWMAIAHGVSILCKLADRPGMSRKARKHLLADNGYGTVAEGTVSRLLRMVENETAIHVWRGSLTESKRERWNSPTSICSRCPAVRKAIAESNKDRPPRERKPKDARLAVEKALDVIGDLAYDLKDTGQRAAIRERLLVFARQFGKPAGDAADEPVLLERAPAVKQAAPKLHTPNKDVRTGAYCGPTAIAAVTGESDLGHPRGYSRRSRHGRR